MMMMMITVVTVVKVATAVKAVKAFKAVKAVKAVKVVKVDGAMRARGGQSGRLRSDHGQSHTHRRDKTQCAACASTARAARHIGGGWGDCRVNFQLYATYPGRPARRPGMT